MCIVGVSITRFCFNMVNLVFFPEGVIDGSSVVVKTLVAVAAEAIALCLDESARVAPGCCEAHKVLERL